MVKWAIPKENTRSGMKVHPMKGVWAKMRKAGAVKNSWKRLVS